MSLVFFWLGSYMDFQSGWWLLHRTISCKKWLPQNSRSKPQALQNSDSSGCCCRSWRRIVPWATWSFSRVSPVGFEWLDPDTAERIDGDRHCQIRWWFGYGTMLAIYCPGGIDTIKYVAQLFFWPSLQQMVATYRADPGMQLQNLHFHLYSFRMGRWLQKETWYTLGWTAIPSMLNIQNRMFSFFSSSFFWGG